MMAWTIAAPLRKGFLAGKAEWFNLHIGSEREAPCDVTSTITITVVLLAAAAPHLSEIFFIQ